MPQVEVSYGLRAKGWALRLFPVEVGQGLHDAAEILLAESQKLVPVDTEKLKRSGRVEDNGKRGSEAESTVTYGGGPEGVDYAHHVHDDLESYHEPPTQARYLADAVPKCRARMRAAVQRSVAVGRK